MIVKKYVSDRDREVGFVKRLITPSRRVLRRRILDGFEVRLGGGTGNVDNVIFLNKSGMKESVSIIGLLIVVKVHGG